MGKDKVLRNSPYAQELASAEVDECRIERIHIKKLNETEIRFSWWPDGKLAPRPLDVPEHQLLTMFDKAIKNKVFSSDFLHGLIQVLAKHAKYDN